MCLQHQADANIAGCISDTHNAAAGDVVDLCTGDSLAANIEVCSDSDSPIQPLPGRRAVSRRIRSRRLLGGSLCDSAAVGRRGWLRDGSRARTGAVGSSDRRVARRSGCLRHGNFSKQTRT